MQGRLRGKVNKKLKGYTSYVYATHYAISEFIQSKACSLFLLPCENSIDRATGL